MDFVKLFGVILILAVPVTAAWYSLLYLAIRPLGIRLHLHWPTRTGRNRVAAECATLTQRQYVIIKGVLGWGIGVALLMTLTDCVTYALGIERMITRSDIIGNFVAFPLGGILFGYWTWKDRRQSLHGETRS